MARKVRPTFDGNRRIKIIMGNREHKITNFRWGGGGGGRGTRAFISGEHGDIYPHRFGRASRMYRLLNTSKFNNMGQCMRFPTTTPPFGDSKLKGRLQRLVRVCTCQNATLVEISCRGSYSIEAPRGSMLPWSLKIMHWSPKMPQLPESIFPLLPKSLKLIQLLPKSRKI